MKKKCMDKGSKERSPPHNLRQKLGQYICCQNHKLIADIENDIMDPVAMHNTFPANRVHKLLSRSPYAISMGYLPNSQVYSFSIHNDNGNPSSGHHQTALAVGELARFYSESNMDTGYPMVP
ncbi:hypothetical protein Tco_1175602 [Tanacetum coccineum]